MTAHRDLTFKQVNIFEQIELAAKLLDYFLWSNKGNINQSTSTHQSLSFNEK